MALVMTTDFFTPIVDDPFDFGRIAAANALSDVYAMGADPFAALNLACFPRDALPLSVLTDILRGGHAICEAAGVAVIGGHTIDDPEPKFGLAVTGRVHPDRIFTNAGAAIGDLLVLTKPLGTGIIGTAIKYGHADPHHARAAVDSMVALNRGAAAAMRVVGAGACTDITGFGLLGHLLELCEQSNLDARLDLDGLSLLPGTEELVARGVVSTLKPANDQVLTRCEHRDIADDDPRLAAATDPQTSGGLLFSVDPGLRDAALAALTQAGVKAAVIGDMSVKDHKALTCIILNRNAPC